MSGARTDGGAGGAGAGSISIHETQCLKKFHDQQAALPAEERKRAPTRPSMGGAGGASASLEERNALAKQAYEDQVMVRCEGCQRTFSGQDRLEIHMRGCDAAKALKQGAGGMRECMVPGGSAGGGGGGGGDALRAAPKMFMCYICGKEYGSKR